MTYGQRRIWEPRKLGGGIVAIPLTQGREAIIDERDLAIVSEYSWSLTKAVGERWLYARAATRDSKGNFRQIRMHNLILGTTSNERVDHINGNGLDNRRLNLRLATISQNAQNSRRRINNTSGFKGATWDNRSNKWLAQISVDGRNKFLGRFLELEDAAKAYDKAAKQYFGEFALVNFKERENGSGNI